MARIRVNFFEVVGKALGDRAPHEVGRAITRLSAAYRAGQSDLDFASEAGRAGYAWHHLPAHVSDLARLFLDLPELFEGREELRLLGLGAGPGSEVLALLELISAEKSRGDMEGLQRVSAHRVDRERAWDEDFARLLKASREALAARGCGLGTSWDLVAPAAALRYDLGGPELDEALRAELSTADLCVAANLISELPPRGTEELPAPTRALWSEVCAELARGSATRPRDLVVVDRAKAPGVEGRLAELAALASASGGVVEGPKPRTSACSYPLTREAKAIYRHVKLPTTKHEDRPAKNCQTLWFWARWDDSAPGAGASPAHDPSA